MIAILGGLLFWPGRMFAMGCGMLRPSSKTARPLELPAIVLLGAAGLSAVYSVDPILSVLGYSEAPYYGLTAMALVYLAYTREAPDMERAARVAVLCLTVGALLPISEQNGRAGSTMGSPVYLGAAYVVLFPFTKGWTMVLACIGLILTRSKGAMLGVTAGMLAFGFMRGALTRGHLAAAAALAVALGGLYASRPLSDSDWGRVDLVRHAWGAFKAHPALGSGPDTFILEMRRQMTGEYGARLGDSSAQSSAHNDIAQVASTMGAVGLIAYLWLWASAWRLTLRRQDAQVAAMLVGLFVQAKFNPIPVVVHVIAAMALARL